MSDGNLHSRKQTAKNLRPNQQARKNQDLEKIRHLARKTSCSIIRKKVIASMWQSPSNPNGVTASITIAFLLRAPKTGQDTVENVCFC